MDCGGSGEGKRRAGHRRTDFLPGSSPRTVVDLGIVAPPV